MTVYAVLERVIDRNEGRGAPDQDEEGGPGVLQVDRRF